MFTYLHDFTSYALLALFATAAWAPLLINMLYKMNIVVRHVLMRNRMNEEFIKIHAHKSGTPTMGGLMISVTVALLAVIFVPQTPLRDVFLIGWLLFALYGFVEGMMVFARKVDEKFKLMQESFIWRLGKLAILFLIAAGMVMLISSTLGITEIYLFGGLVLPITWLTLPVITFVVGMGMYGGEINDGLDGLVTGEFLIAILTFGVISIISGHVELLPFLGLMLGSCLVYLYFNINPARVFMGGTGTLPIMFALMMFAIITDTVVVFAVMGIVFWIELFSSLIQILSIRFFGRKVFRIAPIHHHFEAIGWPEPKVVQRFWLAAAVAAVVALWTLGVI